MIAVIIEDDPSIRELLKTVFQQAGLHPVAVDNGLDGVEAVRAHNPVVTTLDVTMQGIDGLEAARRIRKFSSTMILMLSAMGEEADIVIGLGAGADQYLVKPFRVRELRARIEAILRRSMWAPQGSDLALAVSAASSAGAAGSAVAGQDDWVEHRDLRLNSAIRSVLVAGVEVDLTRSEFDLLATLMESQRRVRSKSDLALVLRGDDASTSLYVGDADRRAVESHMVNLRRKLADNVVEPQYIETVRGVGYRLTP